MTEEMQNQNIKEKTAKHLQAWQMILIVIALLAVGIGVFITSFENDEPEVYGIATLVVCVLVAGFCCIGFKIVKPNEAYVLTLFGKYYGSLKEAGFYWVIPFCTAFNPAYVNIFEEPSQNKTEQKPQGIRNNKISLKAMTLNNDKQKVNDAEGNPIEIGVVVIWKIVDTAKAAFQVDNYQSYISIQADAVIRNIARQYPYDDVSEDGDEKSLRGSSQEIANMLCEELQERVEVAGIEVVEARISHLAYSQEIAAAMLQRQQAKAIVDARTKIVEGAVGMVELALEKLKESGCVDLDNEKKAQMVSNLMVVLCANKDTQPIVNSGQTN